MSSSQARKPISAVRSNRFPHQNVDRDLGLGAHGLQAFLERLVAELIEQADGQLAKGAAGAAHVGSGARQLPEQAQIVPDRL
jgi:hypothetical protein